MSTRLRLFRLLALLLVSFLAGYFLCRFQLDPHRQPAAKVNGETLSAAELERELRQRFGPDVLRDLVHQRLILQEAQRKNLPSQDKKIEKRLGDMLGQPEVQAMIKAGQVTPEDLKRNLSVLVPLEALVDARITIDDEHEYLNQHRDELESLEVAHILLADLAMAEKVRSLALQPKADFGQLAKKHSQDERSSAQGGKLGELRRSELDPEVGDALFQLQVDEISPPMQGSDGVHLFKVLSRKTALDDLRPRIREILTASVRGEYLEELRSSSKVETFPPYRLPPSRAPGTPTPTP